LRRAAFLLSGDWHLADDLTQTTVTKMFVACRCSLTSPWPLRFWNDLSIDQTAAVMSCSPGTIKSQTAKAQQHLREQLGPGLELLPVSPTTVESQ
jgi:DNA-directed RNA polymerase specialized sigma24 family protein